MNMKKYVGREKKPLMKNPFSKLEPTAPRLVTLREVANGVINGNMVMDQIRNDKNSISKGSGVIRDSKSGKILASFGGGSNDLNAPGASVKSTKPKKVKKVKKSTMSDDDYAEMDGEMIMEGLEYNQFMKKYPSLQKSKYPSLKDMDRMSDEEVEYWYGTGMDI